MRCAECDAVIAPSGRGRPRRYCGRACQARAYRARRDAVRRRAAGTAARVPHAPPDRAAVVRAAVDLADAEGLDAVSLPVLAARTGVAVTTLRRHVAGRDDLVTAMVDAVFARYRPPGPEVTGWRDRLAHEAREEWALYQRHPWALDALATTRPALGPSVLAAMDRFVAALSGPGLDHRTALSVYLLVSGYVQGMATTVVAEREAVRATGVSGRQWWSVRRGRLAGLAGSGRYPWLTRLTADLTTHDADLTEEFDFGLERVLDGVAVFLDGR